MSSKHKHQQESQSFGEFPLFFFACPNPDCADFNPPYVRRTSPRCQRQPAEGYYRCFVRSPQRHRESYSGTGYRLQDKYFSSGAIERDIAKPANAFGQTYSQRLAAGLHVAMGIVAVAGFVQLDEGSWLSGGLLPCDGVGFGRACLVGSGVYSLSYTCQRSPARAVGRAAQECSGIGFGCLSA